jgi:hypothetical protein
VLKINVNATLQAHAKTADGKDFSLANKAARRCQQASAASATLFWFSRETHKLKSRKRFLSATAASRSIADGHHK